MAERRSFGSDNYSGVHEAVLRAVAGANVGDAVAYGADYWTDRATAELCRVFGAAAALLVFTGSAANVLGLSLLLRRHQAVICAESAHVNTDECGACEQVLGAKLLPVATSDGKLTPESIATRLAGRQDEHRAQPGAVALTQSTEVGTCYTLAELRSIRDFCHDNGLFVYIDGARLANAAAHLGCSLAELGACADVLSFGGTKNGGLGADAVIVMGAALAGDAPYLRKQQLQLASKMRFLAAQFLALLDGDLWRTNAEHANRMAQRLADGVRYLPDVEIWLPVESDAVFARLPRRHVATLALDWSFHIWQECSDETAIVRWMTAFDTEPEDVDLFVADVGAAVARSGDVGSLPGRPC